MSLITRPSSVSQQAPSVRQVGAKHEPAPFLCIENGAGLSVHLYRSGVVSSIQHEGIMINHSLGDALRGSIAGVYLRQHTDAGIEWVGLTGPSSPSSFAADGALAVWSGRWRDIAYRCSLVLHPTLPAWCWDVDLTSSESSADESYDVLLVQDLGLVPMDAALINEAYVAQYLDHQIHAHHDYGSVLMTRQNRPQAGGRYPWLAQTSVSGVRGCLTDGYQFFGNGYRASATPAAIEIADIPREVRQYEFACSTLQGCPSRLDESARARWRFISRYEPDHPAVSRADDANRLDPVRDWAISLENHTEVQVARVDRHRLDRLGMISGRELTEDELALHFPGRWRHEERDSEGRLLSAFRENDAHLVTPRKERATERPHGHMLRTGASLLPDDQSLSATAWMHGVFLSHVALGNTVLHKFLPVARNPLDVAGSGGLRLAVEIHGGWKQLAVPSAFEIRRSSVLWCYELEDHTIWITIEASSAAPHLDLSVHVDGEPIRLMLMGRVLIGDAEPRSSGAIAFDPANGTVTLRPAEDSAWINHQPNAQLTMTAEGPESLEAIGGDELLFADGRSRGYPWMVMRSQAVNTFGLRVATAAGSDIEPEAGHDWSSIDKDRQLEHKEPGVERIDDALRWFTHNAIIHLAAPHGLEQFTGGAWGTRDVCQGPLEFLLAAKRHKEARRILTMLFSDQRSDGGWPQWFMIDAYRSIRQAESHGDIIVWPLKALASYLEATGDASILRESLPYFDQAPTGSATLAEHLVCALERIESELVPGTSLIRYGHGDWNDALQPAKPELRERMVSTWTVELLYQAASELSQVLRRLNTAVDLADRLQQLATGIRCDFDNHLVPDDVVCGMGYIHEAPLRVEPLLHPADKRTGIRYRLLPMTRGILSGLLNPESARQHLSLIREHLLGVDGARLMDRPPVYRGGTEDVFQRAESASAFSREIGLMYVHAHLRFIEALARLGEAEMLYDALLRVTPMGLNQTLEQALPRQANAYFSSSDADVMNRAEASDRYADIMDGRVGFKGGWRIYSSGPGIYISAVVRSMLGWRETAWGVEIDPVLPRRLDGLVYRFNRNGRELIVRYRIQGPGFGPQGVLVNGQRLPGLSRLEHPYRRGGLRLPESDLMAPPDTPIEVEVLL
ncbi:GH36-type glycosyl hydrolase domain-containing protein [Mucisphaera sp.]|uniref:GH36-type glycosyl hydrolase domain-containing protein n=1 Tax=Mucisphaera sp. TaxID=2913024 RepID=UPI003D13EB1D